MYNLIVESKLDASIKAEQTNVGDLLIVTKGEYYEEIILHTYQGFVSLNRPALTWESNCGLSVRLLPKGSVITLIVQ